MPQIERCGKRKLTSSRHGENAMEEMFAMTMSDFEKYNKMRANGLAVSKGDLLVAGYHCWLGVHLRMWNR